MRTKPTANDQKRTPFRQRYVNGVLPQSLIITLGGKDGLKISNFVRPVHCFRTFFGVP